jgi:alkylhydroperoxidase family enzyme
VFLNLPPETDANARLYKADLDERGFVMNLSRLWGWRPEIAEGFRNLRNVLTDESTLSKRELGVIVCATAASLGDSYCALAWGRSLSTAADPTTAAAVLRGTESQGLTARDRAISKWARKVVQDPNATTSVDVEDLRKAGSRRGKLSKRPHSSLSDSHFPRSTTPLECGQICRWPPPHRLRFAKR